MIATTHVCAFLGGALLCTLLRGRKAASESPLGPAPLDRDRFDAYRRAFDCSRDGLYLLDEEKHYVDANESWARMLGCDREDLVGQVFGSAVTNGSRACPNDFKETGRYSVARPNAKLELEMSCVGFDLGPQRFTLGRARDVTEREASRRSIERMQAAVDAAQDGLFLADAKGRVLYRNRAARSWLKDEKCAELVAWHVRQGPDANFQIRTGSRCGRVSLSAVKEAFVGCVRDVTEERRLAQKRRATEERLQEARRLGSLGLLAGGVAHDFNNLLTGIQGFAALAHDTKDPEKIQRYLERVLRSSERASALTLQLRQFSQHRAGEFETLDLGQLIEGTLPTLQELMGETMVVQSRICADARVFGDARQLEQLLLNLAANAQAGMEPRSRGRLRIQLTLVEVEGSPQVRLLFEDDSKRWESGEGAKIFEPFAASRGLTIPAVYGIVTRHHGVIEAKASPLGGTRFEIHIPCDERAALNPLPKPPRAAGVGSLTDSQSAPPNALPVLVVDDDETVRELVCSLLTDAGYSVVSRGDAESALELLTARQGHFGLLLSDVILPGRSGADLAIAVSELEVPVPTLLMTGYADVDLPEHLTVIDKPFAPQDLLRRVKRAVIASV